MRYALAASVLLLLANSANAMPWEKHPFLSQPGRDMASAPGELISGRRKVRTYFSILKGAGLACDAKDMPRRRIHITCADAKDNFVYDGQFIGAGYLDIDRVVVNGNPLTRDGIIRHLRIMYGNDDD